MLEYLDSDSRIFTFFEEVSGIPRGSGHNEKISRYLCEFAEKRGLDYKTDKALNVLIRKPGTGAGKGKPPVILQGHMDMVCVREEGVAHDFEKEGLVLKVSGDDLSAEGTTLGGDDGIALAYGLALLDSEKYTHPPLEVLFTTDEETGMDGAHAVEASWLQGKQLLNLDNEEEGILLVSCAGGSKVRVSIPAQKEKTEGVVYELLAKGLHGGHSGTEIHRNATNAVILLCRILWNLSCPYRILSLFGGDKDNVIPDQAKLQFVIHEKFRQETEKQLMCMAKTLTEELRARESGLDLSWGEVYKTDVTAFTEEDSERAVNFCNLCITGVQTMSADIEGMVESSLNMGITYSDEKGFHFGYALRSQKATYKRYMEKQLDKLAERFGGLVQTEADYPAWDYKEDSVLREIAAEEFRKLYAREPRIEGIHAGLECGILAEKIPDIDIISFGPQIRDIHTTSETMSIQSAKQCFTFLLAILNRLAE